MCVRRCVLEASKFGPKDNACIAAVCKEKREKLCGFGGNGCRFVYAAG